MCMFTYSVTCIFGYLLNVLIMVYRENRKTTKTTNNGFSASLSSQLQPPLRGNSLASPITARGCARGGVHTRAHAHVRVRVQLRVHVCACVCVTRARMCACAGTHTCGEGIRTRACMSACTCLGGRIAGC
jgi:hypothetical protein